MRRTRKKKETCHAEMQGLGLSGRFCCRNGSVKNLLVFFSLVVLAWSRLSTYVCIRIVSGPNPAGFLARLRGASGGRDKHACICRGSSHVRNVQSGYRTRALHNRALACENTVQSGRP